MISETEYCYRTQEQCEAVLVTQMETEYEGYQVVRNADKPTQFIVIDENGKKAFEHIGWCSWYIIDTDMLYQE